MTFYQIQASVTIYRRDGSTTVRQIPTFFLCADINGIVDECHAEKIAGAVLDATKLDEDINQFHIHASKYCVS